MRLGPSTRHSRWRPWVDDADVRLRNLIYQEYVDCGVAPNLTTTAEALDTTGEAVAQGLRRLHDEHALVLHANSTEIRMLNPFSLVPTAHRVHARGHWWFANCAWDALGIGAALGVDTLVETSCPDCGESLRFETTGSLPSDSGLLFHCLVPARQWWTDIGFT